MPSPWSYRTLWALVALLFVFANALSVYERSNNPISYRRGLQARADDEPVDPPLPPCIPPCGPGCAGPYLNDQPAGELTAKRHVSNSDISKREFDLVFAGSEVYSLSSQGLFERNFYKVTQGNIDTWMKNKVTESNSGTVQLVYSEDGDSSSTTRQETFGDAKYEVGTGGLTGCTVLTVISRRAVFMAHFFESLAFSRPTRAQLIADGQDPDTYPQLNFNGQVRNLIDRTRGATVGFGDPIDVSLFNAADDNTQAFIMSPRRWHSETEGTYQFPAKVLAIQTQIQQLLPNIAAEPTDIPVTDYIRLDMEDPAQEAELFTNARGAAFFQYDPKINNQGQKGWRLFYERNLVKEDAW